MHNFTEWIDRISEPQKSGFPNKLMRIVVRSRNRAFFFITAIQMIITATPIFLGEMKYFDCLGFASLVLQAIFGSFFIQKHNRLFSACYALIYIAYMVCKSQLDPPSIINTYHCGLIFPIYQYTHTGNTRSMILGAILTLLYIHNFLEEPLTEYLLNTSPQFVAKSVIQFSSFHIIDRKSVV